MKQLLLMGALLASPLAAFGQPSAFDFNSEEIPAPCILGSGRIAKPAASAVVQAAQDEQRRSGVLLTTDASKGGIVISAPSMDYDRLGGELTDMTIFMAFRADPLSSTPVFLARLFGGTSEEPGFFRFYSQSNSSKETEQGGTLRFNARGADGKLHEGTSTLKWIQQPGQWYWVGVTFSKGYVNFYLDGERLGDEIHFPMETLPGGEGKRPSMRGGYGFAGAFDDLAILPGKALSETEMQKVYLSGMGDETVRKSLLE